MEGTKPLGPGAFAGPRWGEGVTAPPTATTVDTTTVDTSGIANPVVIRRGSTTFVVPAKPSRVALRKRECVNVRVQSAKPAFIRVAIFSGRRVRIPANLLPPPVSRVRSRTLGNRTMNRRLASVFGCGVLLGMPVVANAATPTTLYVWAGGTAPFQPLHGAQLLADGTGQILEVSPDNRENGTVTVVGAFAPSPVQLDEIRARAAALPPSAATIASQPTDGAYALAVAAVNGQPRALLAVNVTDARLTSLFAAVNAALPDGQKLQKARKPVGQHQHAGGPCSDMPATEVSRIKTLQEAAAEGLTTLSAKGGNQGDIVAVDLKGKPTRGPVTMTIHMELVDAQPFEQASLDLFATAAQKRIGPLRASNGTPMTVNFDLRTRLPTDPPSPCYHQITINDTPRFRSFVDGLAVPNDGTGSGTFGSTDPDWGSGLLLAHEGLHLAGLPDQYSDVFRVPGKADVPVPASVNSEDQAALNAWARQVGRDPARGVLRSRPRPGHANDIMGSGKTGARMLQSDVNALVSKAGVHLRADPGDLLANKSADHQNLGVGALLNMFAPRFGSSHRDGLWAYCIDLTRHSPVAGTVLDALGPAALLPGANMAQLQAVLEVIARRPPSEIGVPLGAQTAVWAVTDEGPTLFAEAQSILTEAGVTAPLTGTPHFADANATSPDTGAVNTGGVLATQPPSTEPPVIIAPRIDAARLLPASIPAGRTARVHLGLSLGVTGGKLAVLVQRRTGLVTKTVGRFPVRPIAPGDTFPGLQFPPLTRGTYRVHVSVGTSKIDLPLTVR